MKRKMASQQLRGETSQQCLFSVLVIDCKKSRIEERFAVATVEPLVVFEVLSPSTEKIDGTKKFESNSEIAVLKELVLVSQDRQSVEPAFEDEHELQLWSLGCVLMVGEVDGGLEW